MTTPKRAAIHAPSSPRALAPAPLVSAIDPERHLVWTRAIARGVRADFRFVAGGQEEAELEAAAYLVLIERTLRFDFARVPLGGNADGLFRGWSARAIRSECRREAIRLRNGGTYRTRREWEHKAEGPVVVDGLPAPRCASNLDGMTSGEGPAPLSNCDTTLYRDLRRTDPSTGPDGQEGDEEDEPEPIACIHEPTLVIINSRRVS